LPNSVVEACSVNTFKARLDKIWSHQDVKFDFTASLTGTGMETDQNVHVYKTRSTQRAQTSADPEDPGFGLWTPGSEA